MKAMLVAIPIMLLCLMVAAVEAGPGTIRFSAGNNIWGNTLGAEYQLPVGRGFALGLTYSRGYFAVEKNQWGDFLLPASVPGSEHRVWLDLKQLLDFTLYYQRAHHGGAQFLDEFGIGVTHVFLLFHSEYIDDFTPGTLYGERTYSKYGVVLSVNVLTTKLPSSEAAWFSLGVRSKLVRMDSPQRINYDNHAGRIEYRELASEHGHRLYFPYPEVYAMVGVHL